MKKIRPTIEIYEIYEKKGKDLILEIEAAHSKYSQKELMKLALANRIVNFSESFYIKEWEIIYKKGEEIKKVVYKKHKLLKEDFVNKDSYYVLNFSYVFLKKASKIFQQILFEDKDVSIVKSISSLKDLRGVNYSPTYDRAQMKKLRVKSMAVSLIYVEYKKDKYKELEIDYNVLTDNFK